MQQAYFEASSRITITPKPDGSGSKLQHTDIIIDLSPNLVKEKYVDKEGLPCTKEGSKAMTQAFVQGLIANVISSHKKGLWNEAEHMKYIMDELGRSFATPSEVSTTNW